MLQFFSNLFGNREQQAALRFLELEHEQHWAMGKDIADDCFKNCLSQGEIVTFSDIAHKIARKFKLMDRAVREGFLDRIREYIESGEVVNISFENTDMVFVHKRYEADFVDTNRR